MSDNSPPPPGRKRPLIGPIVSVLALAALIVGGALLNVQHERERAAAARPPPPPPSPPLLKLDLPPPPLARAELVQEASAAASAYASGAKPTLTRSPLIGRRFAIRIPFGCNGPGGGPATAQTNVELDAAATSLKLSAQPAIWTNLPVLQDLSAANKIETVEGFWIPRPWVNSESCPANHATPLPATPTPAAAQTVGLARIFEKGGSRVLMRDGRPYQYAIKLPKDDADLLSHTYRLVLEGRLVGYGDGHATHCWGETPEHRPICLFAVEYDRVAFEDANTGAMLAEWRN